MIYADHNATSPLRPEARDAMLDVFDLGATNPSSVHAKGRAARGVVEAARVQVGGAIGSRAADVIFTGGGTEADALAVQGVVDALRGASTLIVSSIEHEACWASITCPCRRTRLAGRKAWAPCGTELARH